MLERTYSYLGYTINQYMFGTIRYFYPSFNGNAEFTDIREICKYLKMYKWIDASLRETFSVGLCMLSPENLKSLYEQA